jgi:hypothetical protein
MIEVIRRQMLPDRLVLLVIAITVLGGAVFLGSRASTSWLAIILVGIVAVLLLRYPIIGLFGLISAALLLPIAINTGTDVFLYPTALIVPALIVLWFLRMLQSGNITLVSSRTNLPLILFLLAGLLSLSIGHVLWDPNVPRPGHFVFVQFAQWAIFAFSAGAFWLIGNWLNDVNWLRRVTFFFLTLAGILVISSQLLGNNVMGITTDGALIRTPFWVLLFAIAAGQLLFNEELKNSWRLFLSITMLAILLYAFGQADERASNWVGVTTALGALCWLRFPRLRWPVAGIMLLLLLTGFLQTFIYEFAGGDARWFESGGARIALIERTIKVTSSNPLTGLGPAAYRYYAATQPLVYEHIVWFNPRVASHNNYVDLYSHVGLLGLALFLWFMIELAYLGWRLRASYQKGFAAGYVNGMLATWTGMMVVMLLADWF